MDPRLRRRVMKTESRFPTRMNRTESHLREDVERPGGVVARLEHGQTKIGGLLEVCRGTITCQTIAQGTRHECT